MFPMAERQEACGAQLNERVVQLGPSATAFVFGSRKLVFSEHTIVITSMYIVGSFLTYCSTGGPLLELFVCISFSFQYMGRTFRVWRNFTISPRTPRFQPEPWIHKHGKQLENHGILRHHRSTFEFFHKKCLFTKWYTKWYNLRLFHSEWLEMKEHQAFQKNFGRKSAQHIQSPRTRTIQLHQEFVTVSCQRQFKGLSWRPGHLECFTMRC